MGLRQFETQILTRGCKAKFSHCEVPCYDISLFFRDFLYILIPFNTMFNNHVLPLLLGFEETSEKIQMGYIPVQ